MHRSSLILRYICTHFDVTFELECTVLPWYYATYVHTLTSLLTSSNANLHAISVRREFQATFKCKLFAPNILPTKRSEPRKNNEKWPGFFPLTERKRKFTFFSVNTKIYRVENNSNLTRATHSWNYCYFQHIRWIWYSPKKVKILNKYMLESYK